jgi:DNA-binding LytR/AlgR family response regulator
MQNVSILIVEDEIIVATDLSFRLTKMGFRVTAIAGTSEEAIASFKEEKPDLVLTDIHLHGQPDGIDTVLKLREISFVPIIYLTAQSDMSTVARAKATFPAAYLTKPFDDRQLQVSIELALHNFSVQKQVQIQEKSTKPVEKTEHKATGDNILHAGDTIFIKQGYKFVKLLTGDLLFITADGIYTDIITRQHRYSLRLPMNQVMEKIAFPTLVRTHRSYAVNIINIDEFNDSEITISGSVIPIGGSFKESFLGNFEIR